MNEYQQGREVKSYSEASRILHALGYSYQGDGQDENDRQVWRHPDGRRAVIYKTTKNNLFVAEQKGVK